MTMTLQTTQRGISGSNLSVFQPTTKRYCVVTLRNINLGSFSTYDNVKIVVTDTSACRIATITAPAQVALMSLSVKWSNRPTHLSIRVFNGDLETVDTLLGMAKLKLFSFSAYEAPPNVKGSKLSIGNEIGDITVDVVYNETGLETVKFPRTHVMPEVVNNTASPNYYEKATQMIEVRKNKTEKKSESTPLLPCKDLQESKLTGARLSINQNESRSTPLLPCKDLQESKLTGARLSPH